jgi:hypothetical protein
LDLRTASRELTGHVAADVPAFDGPESVRRMQNFDVFDLSNFALPSCKP